MRRFGLLSRKRQIDGFVENPRVSPEEDKFLFQKKSVKPRTCLPMGTSIIANLNATAGIIFGQVKDRETASETEVTVSRGEWIPACARMTALTRSASLRYASRPTSRDRVPALLARFCRDPPGKFLNTRNSRGGTSSRSAVGSEVS
jgi:hypothetical protein